MQARINWDHRKTVKVNRMLKSCSLFADNPEFRTLQLTKKSTTTVYWQIVDKMAGYDASTYECSWISQAHNMTTKTTLDTYMSIKCDLGLLFQQPLLALLSNLVGINELLSFELESFPLSLLKAVTFFRR